MGFRCNPAERTENVTDGNAGMNAHRKSDESVVPATLANNGATEAPAESTEERDSAKRNAEHSCLAPDTDSENASHAACTECVSNARLKAGAV